MKKITTDPMTPMEWADEYSPSMDHTHRFLIDQQLRARGYVIAERPRTGPVLWMRNGIVFTQEEVCYKEGINA